MPKPSSYEPIPEFGQFVEYITQAAPVEREGDIYYGLEFHHLPLTRLDLTDDGPLRAILEDYVKVFRILSRVLDLELPELTNVIPNAIRLRINVWLTSRGYPTIPAGWTWKQLLVAIKQRTQG